MSILAWIEDQRKLKILNAPKYKHPSSDGSQGLWTRCDNCGVILYIKHLKENQRVCFGCHFHLQMDSSERVQNLIDAGTWRPLDETMSPCDPLEFRDQKPYLDRLKEAQERTGLQDALQTGTGLLDGIPVALGVMDFNFMGGSMGSVVGEKLTRLIEYATQEGLTLIVVCASGGARMQEGIFSLMQMSKISAALHVHQSCANLLYISVLTSPTTGGVTASFAMLGDLIFAEPKALIGFAGRRVIEQTLQEDLPDDFQTSEYLLHHGLLDLIVPRCFLKQALAETITLYKDAPYKETGEIPFGIQPPLSFVQEERVRRQFQKMEKNARVLDVFKNNKDWNINDVSTNIAHALDIYAKDKTADFLYREVLTSFETMFSLVAPNRSTRSEHSDTPTLPVTDVATAEAFFEQALQLARTESIQWRTLYETKPEATEIPFLDFFAQKSSAPESEAAGKSLLYRIVKLDTTHAAHATAA
uniref:Acetyl-coenzyme A carboxylase carboxyl transferase subunit beta, chloroplastic n=1 Tax=Choricystis parasitica TaxID=41300 RepID=A0A097KNS2_9CHLO|nr:beta subunit of acetyl-CoA carboxylase carboxytransferase [Choricystis parasitica]AIT94817.1 beta subunit of acetyl-CoA carboxylase carboxytransferase [Choricystis parasitica]